MGVFGLIVGVFGNVLGDWIGQVFIDQRGMQWGTIPLFISSLQLNFVVIVAIVIPSTTTEHPDSPSSAPQKTQESSFAIDKSYNGDMANLSMSANSSFNIETESEAESQILIKQSSYHSVRHSPANPPSGGSQNDLSDSWEIEEKSQGISCGQAFCLPGVIWASLSYSLVKGMQYCLIF